MVSFFSIFIFHNFQEVDTFTLLFQKRKGSIKKAWEKEGGPIRNETNRSVSERKCKRIGYIEELKKRGVNSWFNFFHRPKYPSCLFFQYNTQLGPPYHILVDTNFINFSIKAKLDVVQSMMDCLYAKCKYLSKNLEW